MTAAMIELDIQPKKKKPIDPEEDNTFRILILSDLGAADVSRPQLIDRDNFEEVMQKLKVSVELPLAGKITFQDIDDFHPDQLYRRLDLFHSLRQARSRLENPETSKKTAEMLFTEATPQATTDILKPSSVLDAIVEESTGGKYVDPFADYVRKLVAPYTVPKPDPKLPDMLAEIDAAVSGNMRQILHDPTFQSIEAAWRAIYLLTRNVETSIDLKVYVMHFPKSMFVTDLLKATSLKDTVFRQILGAQKWALVAGNYYFTGGEVDMELLGRVALITDSVGARFVAGAEPDVSKWLTPSQGYQELRTIPEAESVALALPRWIQRMPYGKNASETETFAFEEIQGKPEPDQYVWANPAFAVAYLMADMHSSGEESLNIHSLPAHMYKDDGENVVNPCAEFLMRQVDAEKLMDNGLMPLLSMKGQDWIRLAGFRAINGKPFVD
jgi:type VI secretion system protein ImpC